MYVEVVNKSSTLKLGLTGVMRLFGCSAANALMQRTVELIEVAARRSRAALALLRSRRTFPSWSAGRTMPRKTRNIEKKFQGWLSKAREIDDAGPGSVQTSVGASAT